MATIQELREAGFSDQEIGQWTEQERTKLTTAGFDDHEVNNYLTGINLPRDVPKPFLERFLDERFKALERVKTEAAQAFGDAPLGLSDKFVGEAKKFGLFNDYETGNVSPLRTLNEMIARPAAAAVDTLMRGFNAGITGIGEMAGESARMLGSETPERLARDVRGLLETTALLSGAVDAPIFTPRINQFGKAEDLKIGGLPQQMDFVDSATVIGNKLGEPEQAGVATYTTAKGSQYTVHEDGTTTRFKSFHPEHGEADQGLQPRSQITFYVDEEGANALGEFQSQGGPTRIIAPLGDGRWGVKYVDGKDAGKFERRTVVTPATEPGVGLTPVEIFNDGYRVHFGNEITEVRPNTPEQTFSSMSHVEQKLLQAYEEKGLHPAEVAHDAQIDPTVKQEMLSVNPGLPERYVGRYEDATTRLEVSPEQEVLPPEPQAGGGGKGPPPIEGPIIEGEAPRPLEGPRPQPSLEEATQTILDHISVGEREPRRGWSFSRFYTDRVDSLNPIKRLEREVGPVSADESPYAAYRMLTGSPTQAHDMIMGSGVPNFAQLYKTGVRPEDVGTAAPSLREILEPVRGAEELDKFRAFATAARTIELERRGIETGFDLDAAKVVARGYADKYAETLAKMVDFQNKVSGALVESGLISRNARAGLLQHNLIYTPFYRVLEPEEGAVGRAGSLMPRNPLNRIIGSERQVIDPLESIIKNTYLYTQMANRNLAARSLVDYMEKAGLAPKVEVGMIPALAPEHVADLAAWLEHYGTPKPTADNLAVFVQTAASQDLPEGTIAVFKNGQRNLHNVDPEIARAVRGLDRESVNTLVKWMGQWTSMLRAGSTLVPEFAGRHIVRDFLYAFVTSPGGFSPLNMVRGVAHLVKQDELHRDWVRSGAANVTMQAFDRRWLQEDVRQLTADTGLMTRAWNVVASPELSVGQKAGIGFRAAIHPLQVLTEIAQSASHIGAFEKALNRGASMREAAWESRETAVDISRRGARMQAYNMISAFANVTIQDTDRWMRELSPRDPKKAAGAMMKIMAGITLPSIMLWMNNHNDPDWKELHDWEKDLFWLVPMGTGPPSVAHQNTPGWENKNSAWAWARIPKPWGMGLIFGSGVERALDALMAQKPDAFKNFFTSIREMNVPGMVPSAITPVLEQWANKSMFTGRPLIPEALKGQLPEYQYTPYTTQTAQAIGHLIGAWKPTEMSPVVMENYLRGWTGQLGNYVLQLADFGLRQAGVVPDPPKPLDTLADLPVVRAFVARYPFATTQSLTDFHEEFQRRSEIYKTYMKQTEEGNEEAAKKLLAMGGQEMFVRLDQMNVAIARMGNLARMVYTNPQMSPSDKRQQIDTLYGNMTEIAKAGNKVFRETKIH